MHPHERHILVHSPIVYGAKILLCCCQEKKLYTKLENMKPNFISHGSLLHQLTLFLYCSFFWTRQIILGGASHNLHLLGSMTNFIAKRFERNCTVSAIVCSFLICMDTLYPASITKHVAPNPYGQFLRHVEHKIFSTCERGVGCIGSYILNVRAAVGNSDWHSLGQWKPYGDLDQCIFAPKNIELHNRCSPYLLGVMLISQKYNIKKPMIQKFKWFSNSRWYAILKTWHDERCQQTLTYTHKQAPELRSTWPDDKRHAYRACTILKPWNSEGKLIKQAALL